MRIFKIAIYVYSALSIAFMLFFMIGEGFKFWEFSGRDIIISIFFPILLLISLMIGFKNITIGAYLSVLSFIGFYVINFIYSGNFPAGIWFFLLYVPGFLMLFYTILNDIRKM